jgi:hypothetical protein
VPGQVRQGSGDPLVIPKRSTVFGVDQQKMVDFPASPNIDLPVRVSHEQGIYLDRGEGALIRRNRPAGRRPKSIGKGMAIELTDNLRHPRQFVEFGT